MFENQGNHPTLNASSELQPAPIANSYDGKVPSGNVSKEDFEAMVEKTKEYVVPAI